MGFHFGYADSLHYGSSECVFDIPDALIDNKADPYSLQKGRFVKSQAIPGALALKIVRLPNTPLYLQPYTTKQFCEPRVWAKLIPTGLDTKLDQPTGVLFIGFFEPGKCFVT